MMYGRKQPRQNSKAVATSPEPESNVCRHVRQHMHDPRNFPRQSHGSKQGGPFAGVACRALQSPSKTRCALDKMVITCFSGLNVRLCPASGARLTTSARAVPFQLQQGPASVQATGRAHGRLQIVKASQETETDSALSGEWPVNWSLASYEDVGEFFQQNLFKDQASPGTTLRDLMSSSLKVVTPDERLDQLGNVFNVVSVLRSNRPTHCSPCASGSVNNSTGLHAD